MKRRLVKKSHSGVHRGSAGWSVMVIDGAPIRRQACADYERVLRDLTVAKQDLERHESHDKPGYLRWLHANFGPLLTEMRETHQKLAAARELLFELEMEAFFQGISMEQAYRQRMDEQSSSNHSQSPGAEAGEEQGGSQAENDTGGTHDPFGNGGSDDFGSESGDNRSRRRGGRASSQKQNSKDKPDRVKELYRLLARRLHPDLQSEMTPQKLEFWHQAQAAYAAGDAERLEVILSLCEIAEKGAAAETSVSLLKRITAQFKSSLRSLKKQLVRCKRDPAWDFTKRTDLKRLASQTERQLLDELFQLKRVLGHFEFQLEKIAAAAKRIRMRRSPRSRRNFDPDETEFF